MDTIFISHTQQDIKVAKKINAYLQLWGEIVYSEKDLSMSMDMASKITDAILKCQVVIIIVSETSLNSAWCRKEWETAIEKRKLIIPISIGGIEKSKLPDYLHNIPIIEYDSLLESPNILKEKLFRRTSIGLGSGEPLSEPKLKLSMEKESLSKKNNRVRPKHKHRKIWVIAISILTIVVLIGIFQMANEIRMEKGLIVAVQKSDSLRMHDSLIRQITDSLIQMNHSYDSMCQKLKSSLKCKNDTTTVQESALSTQGDSSKPSIPLHPISEQAEEAFDSVIQQQYPSSDEIIPINPSNQNSSMPPPPTTRHPLTSIILMLLLFVNIIMTVLFFLLRHKVKHLKTELKITSDAKLQARIGGNDMLIQKGEERSVHLPLGMQKLDLDYATFNNPKRINCFIAGSTALQAERDALRATISLVCNRWKEKNFQIFSFTYEDFERKFAPNGQQSLYDYFIENEANVAVFLIKGEIGDFTITEFNKAYKSFKDSNRPSIIVYYDRSSELNLSALELKKRVQSIGQYWVDYNTLNEMKYHFQEVLSTDLWTLYEKELSAK